MGRPLTPAITNTYMECSKDMAMNRAVGKPPLWSRYVDGSFVVWKHIIEDLHTLLHNRNNSGTSNKFTVESEVDGPFRFMDVSVMEKEDSLTTTVHRIPSHTGRYLATITMILCRGSEK
jgi:hypothetical protein